VVDFAALENRINAVALGHCANATALVGPLAIPVRGVFDAAWVDALGVGQPQPVFECPGAGTEFAEGETLVIGSTLYRVRGVSNERGITRLDLKALA